MGNFSSFTFSTIAALTSPRTVEIATHIAAIAAQKHTDTQVFNF
jgi:hypothetical protein